jgi:CHAT domain-containing protein
MCASAGEGLFGGVLIVLLVGGAADAAGQADPRPDTVLVRFDAQYHPTLSPVTSNQVRLEADQLGLVVWAAEGGDRRQVFRGTWSKPARTPAPGRFWQVADHSGTRGNAAAAVSGVAELTTQLDPLLLPGVIKSLSGRSNQGFLTPPHNGVILGTRPTFRRLANDPGRLPAASALLRSGNVTARVPFAAGQPDVRFDQISSLPEPWREGLPAGRYELQWEESQDEVLRFTVEMASIRGEVNSWLDQWNKLAKDRPQAFHALVAVEYLIARTPYPYLADALDLIDGVADEQLTPYLKWRRLCLIALLEAKPEPPPRATKQQAVGIAEIDEARMLIASGRWSDAMGRLEQVADQQAGRARAMADLYRGVIHAEWGLGEEQAADFYFRRAIAGLQSASVSDRFRAYSNYGNFLLNRAQDRSLDHAFQMAAGVNSLFVDALIHWDTSRQYFETAEQLAAELSATDRASAYVDLARLYAMLADMIAILDSPDPEQRQLQDAERALSRRASSYIAKAIDLGDDVDGMTRCVAQAIQSHLAYRAGEFALSEELAAKASDGYVRLGALAGLEGIERLRGLLELRSRANSGNASPSDAAGQAALRHFLISHLLAEFLRAQVPADRVGRTRASFFARRSYVNERIVELLIASGDDREALRFAELAKARALQDLLASQGRSTGITHDSKGLTGLLDRWPQDIVAVEYFLTSDKAVAFVVSSDGVRAHVLKAPNGQPIPARQLVTDVQLALRAQMDQYSDKLRARILEGDGFDHQWQRELNHLANVLLPQDATSRLAETRILLIVPHHILHYFPFAALVTKCDDRPRDAMEMVKPTFLADESCSICYAPSLSTWQLLRDRKNRPVKRVAAVGIQRLPGARPLPGVVTEIDALRKSLGHRSMTVLMEQRASKTDTLAMMREPGLLLIGTHGRNRPDEPLESDLLLYPQGRSNGRLSAAELYGRDIETDLIILSACYTGLADKSPLPGDDLFGLQRALLQSGARTVVTGQWDIYDATGPEIMGYFFKHLGRGRTAPEALADAQRQFLAGLRSSSEPEPWLHPYFWAVYTVAGDDRTYFENARGVLFPTP